MAAASHNLAAVLPRSAMPKAKQGEAVASCEAEAEEVLEEEDEAPVLGAEVAFAKSGRSCCKECRKPIAMGALRIGGASAARVRGAADCRDVF